MPHCKQNLFLFATKAYLSLCLLTHTRESEKKTIVENSSTCSFLRYKDRYIILPPGCWCWNKICYPVSSYLLDKMKNTHKKLVNLKKDDPVGFSNNFSILKFDQSIKIFFNFNIATQANICILTLFRMGIFRAAQG